MTVEIFQCGEDTKDRSIAYILHLMARSENYRHWTVNDIQRNLFPAVRFNQCILVTLNRTPMSFVTWARFDKNVSDQLRIDGRTPLQTEWRADGELWFVDFASPDLPAKSVIKAIGAVHFRNEREAFSIRRNPDATIRKINHWKRRG